MKNFNPLEVFTKEAPEIQEAYANLIYSLVGSPGLDSKTKQIVYIAMKVVSDDENAVLNHILMAKQQGATRDEIKDTIVLSLTVIGLMGVSKCLP
jgi:alkylhydroperoxidase/carboxymuconolactone decarboxylase family protein YurZ